MPRPGPRPYECIRRAWHSDRHQPMRGSLIQEIFRVVNEIHSSATKKNKEWQDKLPLVVLKAEEIMYSKANSEAEYMDLKTLWERTNDSINTIIRRDESSESGELLQPCIEAALNLGCTPRRASRSQRHNTPRFYLTPNMQEATTQMSVAPKNSEIFPYDGSCRLLPPCPKVPIPNSSPEFFSYYSSLLTSTNVNSTQLGSDSCDPVSPDESMPHEQRNPLPISSGEFPPFPKNFALSWKDKSSLPMDPSLSVGMHPLHNSTKHLVVESGSGFLYPQGSNHDANMLTMPHVRPIEEARSGFFQNHLGCDNAVDASNRAISRSLNFAGTSENPHVGCDLSLRLWPLRTPCLSAENSPNVEDAGSSSHDKFCDPSASRMRTGHYDCSSSSPRRHQGFCFFPGESSKAPWNDTQVNGVTRGKI